MVAGQHGRLGVPVQGLVMAGREAGEGHVQTHLQLDKALLVLAIQIRCQYVMEIRVQVVV